MNDYIAVLKCIVPYHATISDNCIGYEYNILKNELLLPPSEVSEFKDSVISVQKADRILRLECFSIEVQLGNKIDGYSKLDALSQFVLVAMVKLTSMRNVLSQTVAIEHIKEGRFTLAAYELERIGTHARLVRILKTGRVS